LFSNQRIPHALFYDNEFTGILRHDLMKMALSHLRELAKNFPCNDTILNEIKGMKKDIQQLHKEITTILEPFDQQSLSKTLKIVRDSAFHYPNHKKLSEMPEVEKVIDELNYLDVVKEKGANPMIGQFYLFGSKASATLLNRPLNKENVDEMARITTIIFDYTDGILHHYHSDYCQKMELFKKLKR